MSDEPKSQNNKAPQSLAEAIAKLEDVGQSAVSDFQDRLVKDFDQVKSTLDELKPLLSHVRGDAEQKFESARTDVESKMKQNPWLILGFVGLLAFFIGWALGKNKKS